MVKKTNLLYLYMVLLSCALLPVRAAMQGAARLSTVVSSSVSLPSDPSLQPPSYPHGVSSYSFPPPTPMKEIDNTRFSEELLGQDGTSTIFSKNPGKKIMNMAMDKRPHVVPKHLDKMINSPLPQRKLLPQSTCSSVSPCSSTTNSITLSDNKEELLVQIQMMIKESNKKLEQEINDLKNDMKLRDIKINSQSEDIKKLTKKVEQGQKAIDKLKMENGHLRNIVDDLNIQVNKITKERNEYKKERDAYKKKWKHEKDKAERLQSQLAENPDFLNEGPQKFINKKIPLKYALGGMLFSIAGAGAVMGTKLDIGDSLKK